MYIVDIHPWIDRLPNKDVKITSYKFENRDKAIEFATNYNAHSIVKVAVLVEDIELEIV